MYMTDVAAVSTAMNSTRLYTEISLAVMKQGLDAAEAAGEGLVEMLDEAVVQAPAIDGRLLDTYA